MRWKSISNILYFTMNMKKALIILIILFSPLSVFAQTSMTCTAIDAITQDPIPFVIVYNKTTDKVVYSDEQGSFDIGSYHQHDTIVLSCMAYNEKMLTVSELSKHKNIALSRKENMMSEVVVSSNKKEKTIPYLPKKMHITFGSNMASEMAFKAKFPDEDATTTKKIIKVKIRVKLASDNNPVRIHIYDVAANGMPGNDILNQNIILSSKNISFGQLVLDVSQYEVYTSQKEVFVGLEWLGVVDKTKEFEPGNLHPRVRFTDEYSEVLTYHRVVNMHEWIPMQKGIFTKKNPANMLVSIIYQ